MKKHLCLLLSAFFSGCAGLPEGLEAVSGFELDRYLGAWHEIARLDHPFERGLVSVTAEYSMREDGGVRVVNRGYDTAEKTWKRAEGRAYFAGDPSVGMLKVSFFRPFYGGYNIIALDKEDYSYAMVAGPSRKYFWILSREPEMERELLERLIGKATEMGFDTSGLIFPGAHKEERA